MPSQGERLQTLEAIRRSFVHRSVDASTAPLSAMTRCTNSFLSDPSQALDLVRALVQKDINHKIRSVMNEYVRDLFAPAVKNAKLNLGEGNVNANVLLDDVCASALENAKQMYRTSGSRMLNPSLTIEPTVLGSPVKKLFPSVNVSEDPKDLNRLDGNLVVLAKQREAGPKWDSKRLTAKTMFVLGSKANKALGLGQTRGRLYTKHPELFKYSIDQEDKEWLTKNKVVLTTGGKAYLMMLQDIVSLSQTEDYASHPKQKPDELVGFQVPHFMLIKMQQVMDRNLPDGETKTGLAVKLERGQKRRKRNLKPREGNAKKRKRKPAGSTVPANVAPATSAGSPSAAYGSNDQLYITDEHQDLVTDSDEDKDCEVVTANFTAGREDLGSFLHEMNLNTLVKEFESVSSSSGNLMIPQHLEGILSLADENDGVEQNQTSFPDLPDPERGDDLRRCGERDGNEAESAAKDCGDTDSARFNNIV